MNGEGSRCDRASIHIGEAMTMIYENTDKLKKALDGILEVAGEREIRMLDEKRLRDSLIDDLVYDRRLQPPTKRRWRPPAG